MEHSDVVPLHQNIRISEQPPPPPDFPPAPPAQAQRSITTLETKWYMCRSADSQKVIVLEEQSEGLFSCLSCCACFVDKLKDLVATSSENVRARVLSVLTLWSPQFFSIDSERPDLYGPFWILATLALSIPVVSNISRYQNSPDFKYDFSLTPLSIALVSTIGMALPLLLAILSKLMGGNLTIRENYCIYGYSYFIIIPMLYLCLIPNNAAVIAVIVVFFLWNVAFLLLNYNTKFDPGVRKYVFLAVVLLLQAAIAVLFKLYFFDNVYSSPAPLVPSGSGTTPPEPATTRHFFSLNQ